MMHIPMYRSGLHTSICIVVGPNKLTYQKQNARKLQKSFLKADILEFHKNGTNRLAQPSKYKKWKLRAFVPNRKYVEAPSSILPPQTANAPQVHRLLSFRRSWTV